MRNSIYLRYNLAHYLYTLFNEASTKGTPIMRAMWLEFPKDTEMPAIENQFMFGSDILVSPKVGEPADIIDPETGDWTVNLALPASTGWYNYNDKSLVASPYPASMQVADDQIAMFIREGAILPILDFNFDRLSLTAAIDDPLKLQIFPDW